jgi:type IV pilus assembly protein PilC
MIPSATHKHAFYAELAKLVEAGFGIREAGKILQDTQLPGPQQRLLELMQSGLEAGKTIADSFSSDPVLVSDLERSIIGAGERGGRLAPAFQHLSDYFQLLATARSEALRSMIYPVVLLHLGIILGGVSGALTEGESTGSILTGIAITLSLVYGIGGVVVMGSRSLLKAARTHAVVDGFLNRIPLLGKARRDLALARFTKVYHTCLLAGLSMQETAATATAAAQSGMISEAGKQLAATLKSGGKLGPVFITSRAFPKAFARSYSTAEESGMLDKDLARWADLFQLDAVRGAKRVTATIPKLFYAIVVIFIVWKILGFYQHYYDSLDTLGE